MGTVKSSSVSSSLRPIHSPRICLPKDWATKCNEMCVKEFSCLNPSKGATNAMDLPNAIGFAWTVRQEIMIGLGLLTVHLAPPSRKALQIIRRALR